MGVIHAQYNFQVDPRKLNEIHGFCGYENTNTNLNHLQTVARPPTPRHVPRGSPGVTPAPADRNETNDDTTVSMSLLQPRPPAIPGHTMNSDSAPALTSTPRRSTPHPVIRESALPSSPCPGAEGDSAEGIDNSQPSQTSDSMDTEYY